jgi:hypothetical protein
VSKYCLTFEDDGDVLLQQDTDNEPPRVGEWLDMSDFGLLGNFVVRRIQHQLGSSGPAYITIYVEKKASFTAPNET